MRSLRLRHHQRVRTGRQKVRSVEIDTEEMERRLGFMKGVGERWEQVFGERSKDQKLRELDCEPCLGKKEE